LVHIPDQNKERHEIIQSLYWHRFTLQEIADYLNKLGYQTPKGKTYYGQLIGAILSKLKRRKQRSQKSTLKVSEITFGQFS